MPSSSPLTLLPALLLMLAICAVWLPAPATGLPGKKRLPLWLPLLASALAAGVALGQIRIVGVAGAVLSGLAAWGAIQAGPAWRRRGLLLLALLSSLLLALHRWPGFLNPLVLPLQAISADARPFLLYANFDKGAAGLLLLALLAPRCGTRVQWQQALQRALLPGLLTIALVMGLAWSAGMVRPDLKWPAFGWQFLAINLFLTVVAEEAFFRGVIQQRLQLALHDVPAGNLLALLLSGLLFGAAHLGGGVVYAALAALAGLGYGWVFQRSGRIESAIALHFLLNAIHFLCFTYPALA